MNKNTGIEATGIKRKYLYSSLNDIAIKIEYKQEYWTAKTREGESFRIHHCSDFAKITFLESTEITEEEFNGFKLNYGK
jgi:hypothetical protein